MSAYMRKSTLKRLDAQYGNKKINKIWGLVSRNSWSCRENPCIYLEIDFQMLQLYWNRLTLPPEMGKRGASYPLPTFPLRYNISKKFPFQNNLSISFFLFSHSPHLFHSSLIFALVEAKEFYLEGPQLRAYGEIMQSPSKVGLPLFLY